MNDCLTPVYIAILNTPSYTVESLIEVESHAKYEMDLGIGPCNSIQDLRYLFRHHRTGWNLLRSRSSDLDLNAYKDIETLVLAYFSFVSVFRMELGTQ